MTSRPRCPSRSPPAPAEENGNDAKRGRPIDQAPGVSLALFAAVYARIPQAPALATAAGKARRVGLRPIVSLQASSPPPGEPPPGGVPLLAPLPAAGPVKPGSLWPGVSDTVDGSLRGSVADFGTALASAAAKFKVDEHSIVRDYHMCRTLRALFEQHPPGTMFEDQYNDHKGRPVSRQVGPLLFAGGSALANAYQLADRISEDIDLSIALTTEPESKNALSRIRRLAVVDTARACSPELPDDAHNRRTTGGDVGRRVIAVGNTPNYLVTESSIIRPFDEDLQAELDTATGRSFTVARVVACQSLMGRAADAGMTNAYPELAAFELAALCVPFTAANKFFALHKRAMAAPDDDALDAVRERGRDVYDLWSIAQSPAHAAETNAALPALSRHIHAKGATAEPHPRPAAGFSTSPAFEAGTPHRQALRDGYEAVARDLVWGRKPASFADAVAAIKSLD